MICYKEEIPEHVGEKAPEMGCPPPSIIREMLMASRAPFGQNLFDVDCTSPDAPQVIPTGDRRGWRPSRRKPQSLIDFYRLLRDQCQLA
jgi:hypothetical protein